MLVAEAFDSMTTDRAYRRAMSVTDATAELLRGAGGRFDPTIAGMLVELVRTGRVEVAGPGRPPASGGFGSLAA